MNVLCVIAHADDESFFAGGALAMHARRGDAVAIVAMSDGESSRFTAPSVTLDRAICARHEAFLRACDVISARACWDLTFQDQQADTVPQLDINRAVERRVADFTPDLIYTHHVGDLNLDHRRVAEAVLVATRGKATVRCMTPEWPDRCVGPVFDWTVMVHLSAEDVDTKVRACQCYHHEMRPYPHPRSEAYIREHACESFVEIP